MVFTCICGVMLYVAILSTSIHISFYIPQIRGKVPLETENFNFYHLTTFFYLCRYLKRDALKARFEVKQRLRRLKREKDKQEMQKKEDEDLRQKGRRKVNEDKTKSRAMDELKAKRTAG